MTKPMIGVLPLYDAAKDSYWMLPGYMKGLEETGGIPVMLPLTTNKEDIFDIAKSFDGFLFTGGQDVHPAMYGEEREIFCGETCTERDEMEKLLFNRLMELDKPVLGICRAIQLFNVLLGGTLYQDIPSQRKSDEVIAHKQHPPYDKPVHDIFIKKESLLHSIVKTDVMKVNSYHHQGIKTLSPHLTSIAKAPDDLIEAVSMRNKKFILAVQWHPEFSYKSDEHNFSLFKGFVEQIKNMMSSDTKRTSAQG
ncbi:gamma-glutamyl-gamma-aminobutyrate hydrolase family protein [Salipaludibacillus daqingensis]|uniref:gamma-glutamyl-gamma-aminobutyrate hydrolase family protein n=1 Tax=Salipaludibacillus daqingensis TaxID=3041001 RepID=UPI0024745FE5|nr:gamma-glutamyl-gamma-aminobutyrate hydrolase family protein [Salipaludibacillus daqingensis]